jgi:hypothetical protein
VKLSCPSARSTRGGTGPASHKRIFLSGCFSDVAGDDDEISPAFEAGFYQSPVERLAKALRLAGVTTGLEAAVGSEVEVGKMEELDLGTHPSTLVGPLVTPDDPEERRSCQDPAATVGAAQRLKIRVVGDEEVGSAHLRAGQDVIIVGVGCG